MAAVSQEENRATATEWSRRADTCLGNRDEPVGYKLSSITFTNGMPTEPADSRTPLTDVLTNADINDCPDDCFRPVGLAWDSRQRLFMTSDATGELYVLQRTDVLASASSPAAPTSTSSQGTPEVPSSPIFVGGLAMSAALALGGFGIFGFPLGLR